MRQGVLACSFAREESFSIDSRGGGRESNIRCIPFFVQAYASESVAQRKRRCPPSSATWQISRRTLYAAHRHGYSE